MAKKRKRNEHAPEGTPQDEDDISPLDEAAHEELRHSFFEDEPESSEPGSRRETPRGEDPPVPSRDPGRAR